MTKNNKNNPLSPHPGAPQTEKRNQVAGWSESSSDWDVPPVEATAPSASPIALIAHDLKVCHGSKVTLTDISFTLYRGDTLGLLGLNGAGKSTLLKVLSGSLAPDLGTVHVGENELYEAQIAARMDIGYAPDKPAVYPEFRVTEFLSFIARMRRIPRSLCASSVDQAIEKCALGDVRNRIIGNLSSGYQQRVNLAQALIHNPRILVLDEPANGLDPVQLMEMRELITTLTEDQATIFSSHLLPEVNAICNRVLLIHNGLQILDSPLKQLSHQDNKTFELTIEADSSINLSVLPGVTDACCIAANQWIVTGKSMTDKHLQTMLTSRDIRIISLNAIDDYLESLFRRLALSDRSNNDSDKQ